MQSSKIQEIIIDTLSETVPAMLNIIHKVIIVSNLKIRRSTKKLQKLSLEEKKVKNIYTHRYSLPRQVGGGSCWRIGGGCPA